MATNTPVFGIPLGIDNNGNITPLLSPPANYLELALYAKYFPVMPSLDTEIEDIVLDLQDLINVAVVIETTAHSTLRETAYIHNAALQDYKRLLKEVRVYTNKEHVNIGYKVNYRLPFQHKKRTRPKDF